MPKISKTKKLGKNVRSWSVRAGGDRCPQSKDSEVCRECYAMQGTYNTPNSKKLRVYNEEDWKKNDWETRVEHELNRLNIEEGIEYFRWFDSGDLYDLKLAEKIKNIIKKTPNIKYWIPTRMYKDKSFVSILDEINSLDNAIVRFSNDIINEYSDDHGSVVVDDEKIADQIPHVLKCPNDFESKEITCSDCFKCWDKNTKKIAYLLK